MMVRAVVVAVVAAIASMAIAESSTSEAQSIADVKAKGVAFLKSAQADDGSWTSPKQPGISGLVVYSVTITEGENALAPFELN